MKIHLIGITGKKRHGKDSVCDAIQALRPESYRFAFADALKREVAAACGVTVEYINEHKDNFRLILQGWGTDFRRGLFGNDYWIRQAESALLNNRKVEAKPVLWIATDVRFPNEAEMILRNGGKLIRVERPGVTSNDQHASETAMDDFPVAATVINDHTLKTLATRVSIILDHINA